MFVSLLPCIQHHKTWGKVPYFIEDFNLELVFDQLLQSVSDVSFDPIGSFESFSCGFPEGIGEEAGV